MTEELDRVAAGWALTGFAYLCAGLWVLISFPWPMIPLGGLIVVHGTRCLSLGRSLASGQNDPWQRKTLAKTLVADAIMLAVLAVAAVVTRR